MLPSTKIFAGISMALQLGCAGNVTTKELTPEALKEGVPGVVYYAPRYVTLVYTFTTRVDANGTVARGCTPVIEKEELSLMPDLKRPMLISNSSGAFSAAKFAVTLENGMLTSINAEPTQKLSDILTTLPALLPGVPRDNALGSGNACNAGPRLTVGPERLAPQ